MFREMRRKKQLLSEEKSLEVLKRNTSGVLSVLGDEGFPYGVPINYVYNDGKIYFHSAKEGHKVDSIKNYDKVSFTVIDQDKIVPERYTSYFRSVIAFGKARIIEDSKEMEHILKVLAKKYCKEQGDKGIQEEINSGINHVTVIEFDIIHLTGKEAIEIVNGLD